MNADIVEALVCIGNTQKVKELCEPSIMQPLQLEEWMVKRTLKSLELFEDGWRRLSEDTGGELQEATVSNEGAIHGDTCCF